MSNIVNVGKNEELKRAELTLPKYNEVSDARVVKELQGMFKGFDFNPEENLEYKFKTVESITLYASEAIKEIEQIDNQFKIDAVTKSGAIAAKRWHFGYVVSKCLSSANYGAGLADKLAAASNISVAYVYQYKTVGENLSIRDAYILGMYGAGWENIRAIAAISDEDARKNIIEYYISCIKDWNNAIEREQAKAALKSALEMLKKTPDEIDISNPAKLETAINFETEAAEFVEARKQLSKLMSALRALVKEQKLEAMLKSFGDCYLPESASDAEVQLEALHTEANEALTLLQQVENTIPTIRQELQSLAEMPLSEVENETDDTEKGS